MSIEDWPQELQRIVGTNCTIPAHALHRLNVMVAGEAVDFVDGRLSPVDTGCSGELVVLTSSRVVRADLNSAQSPDPNYRDNSVTYTVQVDTWPRRLLTAAVVATPPEGSRRHGSNSDDAWQELSDQWPPYCYIRLQYRGGQELELPLSSMTPMRSQEFKALVPTLLGDMRIE